MPHALIVEDNMIVSRAVEDRLLPLGFDSFDHAWTAQQALRAAEQRPPDLVIISDDVAGSSPERLARQISDRRGSAIVLITGAKCAPYQPSSEGPANSPCFPLSDIDQAVALSSRQVCKPQAA